MVNKQRDGVYISPAVAVFPGGSTKGKCSRDDEYGHDLEKSKPSTYIEESPLKI